jgi:hypothetical protein
MKKGPALWRSFAAGIILLNESIFLGVNRPEHEPDHSLSISLKLCGPFTPVLHTSVLLDAQAQGKFCPYLLLI